MLRTNFPIHRGPGHEGRQLMQVDVAPLASTEVCGFMGCEFSFKSCCILKSKTGGGKTSNRWVVGPQTKLARVDETQSKEQAQKRRILLLRDSQKTADLEKNVVPDLSSNLCV